MSFKELVDATMLHGKAVVTEDSPPGFKGTVKAMKKHDEVDNPYALAWWMKNKGYESHKKSDGTAKNESIRVEHGAHGTGTVTAITESHIEIVWDNLSNRITAPNKLAFGDAKYLTRLQEAEEYSDDPDDARVNGKAKAKKNMKKKVEESVKRPAPTKKPQRLVEDDGILRFDDLLAEDDEWKKPWEEDDDRDDEMEGDQHAMRDAEDTRQYDGADYTNVPRPSDSVLTNQEDQPSYSADPLATMAGFDAAGSGDEVDGDYGEDLVPVDAPDTPKVRDLEGSEARGNTRNAGADDEFDEIAAPDNNESKPEESGQSQPDDNGGEDDMKKNESAWLDAADLGLELTEMQDPSGGMGFDMGMNEHEMGGEEVAVTCDFMEKLLKACSAQSPDDSKVQALCDGLKAAQAEKGDMALDENDWETIKSHAASAYGGGGDDMGAPDDMGGDDMGPADDMGGDDFEDDYTEGEYEDRAEGDGEPAGPEGGPEHEGKTKMMDRKGMYEKKVPADHDVDDDDDERSMKRRKPKKSKQYEQSGTPIGTGNTSGSGGGGQKDLSKPKKYHGKPVGTGTSGAGGSNANEFGQKPTKDGGANNLPEYESGNSLGAADTVFPDKGQKPAPRRTKPLAAESKKVGKGKKKLDEAIMLGMSSIQGTMRDDHSDVPEDADWDDEINVMRRRAGMDEWWKD